MTEAAIAPNPATIVPEARRMEFLPALFGPPLMLIGERAVYQFMSWLAPDDYTGGLWHFHERESQALFMSPAYDSRFRVFCETNCYRGEVSAEAAGISCVCPRRSGCSSGSRCKIALPPKPCLRWPTAQPRLRVPSFACRGRPNWHAEASARSTMPSRT
jgi:hypothetical protein